MSKHNFYMWITLVSFIIMLIVNCLANTTLLGGRTTGEISNMYPTYMTPAGYAFTIWIVIYILLAGFIYYLFRQNNIGRKSISSIGIVFTLSNIINILWLLLWQYLYIELSVVAMLLLLLTLIHLYRRTMQITNLTIIEQWIVKLPFSLYLGWISIATILNIAIVLSKNEWGVFDLEERTWAVLMLCIGGVVALLSSYPYRDSVIPLVYIWAYIAIALKQRNDEQVFLAASILIVILFVYSMWLFLIRNRDRD
ncbi:tryptophan-rich sensory protein [Paenibacillus crassostreae]|uniref:Tryptophan-rich sensory protein n=1 Tax=Paenibacillus crassostreae TaxID=1763538 RepID=A0A167BSK2_9BACL|nr:tryptophan-rich sensory protein [Paenibacillus crassostreae]AOZ92448.1 hypothetical protein LPB68_09520 [Paenibacillus crassostreae]OAB72396.1 hypothetical protein PNBC_15965 [Paenibacillus crassostreae]